MSNPMDMQYLTHFLSTAPAEEVTAFFRKLCAEWPDLRDPVLQALKGVAKAR